MTNINDDIAIPPRESSVTFRSGEDVKRDLQRLARQEGRTLSNYIERVLVSHIDHRLPQRRDAAAR
jgi:hypothetical protein